MAAAAVAHAQDVEILPAATSDGSYYVRAPGQAINLTIGIRSGPASPTQVVRYYHEIVDYYENVRQTWPPKERTLPPGATFYETVSFSVNEYGVFKLVEHVEVAAASFSTYRDVASVAILPAELGQRGQLPGSRFGMHPVAEGWYHQLARQIGAKWVRTLDFNQICWWVNAEPRNGTFVWFDHIASDILNNGMMILGNVFWTPQWASTYQNPPPGSIDYRYYPPRDWNDWADFARNLVSHYKGKISHWEVWNEPNWAWRGTMDEYMTLARMFYQEAKQADPGCTVVGPGVGEDVGWIASVSSAGLLNYLDVVSVHGYAFDYADTVSIASTRNFIDRVKDVVRRYGGGRNIPLWNTEFSVSTASFFDDLREGHGPSLDSYHYRKAANKMVRVMALNAGLGIEKAFYYWMSRYNYDTYVDETPWGSLLEYTGALTPHGVAYAQAAWILEGARPYGEHAYTLYAPGLVGKSVPVFVFSKGQGSVAVLWGAFGWDQEIDSGINLEISGVEATLLNIFGNPYPAQSGGTLAIPIKSEPVYVVAVNTPPEALLQSFRQASLPVCDPKVFREDFEGGATGWLDGFNGWTAGYMGTVARTTTSPLGPDVAADAACASRLNTTNHGWKLAAETWNDPAKTYTMTFQFAAGHSDIEGGFGFCTGQTLDASGNPVLGLTGPWWYYNSSDQWGFIPFGQNGNPAADKFNGWHGMTLPGFAGKALTAKIVVDQDALSVWGELTDGTTTVTTPRFDFSGFTGGASMNIKGAYLQGSNIVESPVNHGIAVDDVVVTSSPGVDQTGTLSGQITLEGYGGSLELSPVRVRLTSVCGAERSIDITLTANPGHYEVTGVATGTYSVAFSSCKSLRKVVRGVVISTGQSTPLDITLPNGDLDGDNRVGTNDFSILSHNFDRRGD